MFLTAPVLTLLIAFGLFYLIERRGGSKRRNVALGVWVGLGLASFAYCVFRIQNMAPTVSGYDQLGEFILAAAAATFTVCGLLGAGLAWLARRFGG